MRDYYVAIDNGVSGSIAILGPNNLIQFHQTPVKKELNYTKEKQWLNRIDTGKLTIILDIVPPDRCLVVLERPMINPTRFKATVSAIRALEATLIVLEQLKLPLQYIDSKQWQREFLPANVSGEELKPASKQVCARLFPSITTKKDGDSLLMAEWARRHNL
jgi:hypothetical protein